VRVGVVVDRLLGEHQTVIKPLAAIFRHLKALAGSTILGSGAVALVLDMQGVIAAATRQHSTQHLHGRRHAIAAKPPISHPVGV
jgi:two-component system chemotaxis sensor kinase CheA